MDCGVYTSIGCAVCCAVQCSSFYLKEALRIFKYLDVA